MKQKPKLKLYVWEDVLEDWSTGIAFALARSPEHARKLIAKKMGMDHGDMNKTPKAITKPEGFYSYGGG